MEEARFLVSLCLHPPLSLAALSHPFQHVWEEIFFKMMRSNPADYLRGRYLTYLFVEFTTQLHMHLYYIHLT